MHARPCILYCAGTGPLATSHVFRSDSQADLSIRSLELPTPFRYDKPNGSITATGLPTLRMRLDLTATVLAPTSFPRPSSDIFTTVEVSAALRHGGSGGEDMGLSSFLWQLRVAPTQYDAPLTWSMVLYELPVRGNGASLVLQATDSPGYQVRAWAAGRGRRLAMHQLSMATCPP